MGYFTLMSSQVGIQKEERYTIDIQRNTETPFIADSSADQTSSHSRFRRPYGKIRLLTPSVVMHELTLDKRFHVAMAIYRKI